MQEEKFTNVVIAKKPKSLVEIQVLIPHGALRAARKKAIHHIGEEVEVKGFRKGHVPEDMLIAHVGEGTIEAHTLEEALTDALPDLLSVHAPRAIARPLLRSSTKKEAGVLVTLEVSTLPEITLPDYKKIAREARGKEDPKNTQVTDAEFDTELKEHLRAYAGYVRAQLEGEETPQEKTNIRDEDIPALTDEIAKQMGPFAHAEDLKKRLRESLETRKKQSAHEKQRLAILEAILKETHADMPEVLVAEELRAMISELEANLARAGITLPHYLEQIKKTQAEMEAELRPQTEKRATLELLLAEIARAEHIAPDAEKLERDVAHTLEHLKEADPERVRAFIAHRLVNEAVMELLEEAE